MSFPTEYRRNLPHIIPPGGTFFITFRLKDSFPKHILESLIEEVELSKMGVQEVQYPSKRKKWLEKIYDNYFEELDVILDSPGEGPRWLGQKDIADIVAEALHYRDGEQFELICFCIMSNHVHLICKAHREDIPLHKIMGSLKRHTARQANILLKREGPFWKSESYDHLVRDRNELARTIDYVLNNPVKANLVSNWRDWKYSYVKKGYKEIEIVSMG